MRTRTVFFAVSGVFLTLIAATLGSYWWATATQSGRDFVARTAEQQLESLVRGRGKFTIGEVAELRLDRIVLRNVVVTDSNANKVITAGYLYGEISVRALLDRRIHLRELAVRDFTVAMEKGLTGPWNLVRIFFGEEELVPGPHEPGFGDDVRIDLLTLENGAVSIDIPWEPSARIPASMRDSVIELHRSLHDIRDAAGGMIQHTALSLVRAVANSAIFVSPDGSPASLEIDTLVGAISDPPATIMQAHGRLAWTSDSLNLALSAVQLPASTGKAEGVLWWTDPGPVRFDVTLSADAGLEDLAWIWDVMPESGRAHAQVRMRTLADAEDVEYSLTGLEVNSGGSSVHGRVTVTVTPLDLTLSELDLEFTPLETELARRLSYDAVPPEVRGLIRGRLVASKGGPLTDLLIDRMDARFTDRNADGAVSSLSASGRVSLGVEPSARSTVIHSAEIDLRSVAALTDAIPTGLDGILEASGVIRRASLDGAELTGLTVSWVDGAGNITNVAGDVTAMFGSHRRFVDANIRFDPLSVRALARLDTSIHVYSAISGDLEVKGPLDSLVWKTNLSVPSAGRITASGRGSIQDGRWKAQGSSRFETFDVAEWAGRSDLPGTSLSGTLGFTAGGRSNTSGAGVLDGLSGDIRVTQDGSLYRPAFNFFAGMRLDDERLSVDSARVTMGGIVVSARGALARDSLRGGEAMTHDTIEFSFDADSIGRSHMELRRLARMLEPVDTVLAGSIAGLVADSIDGVAVGSGYLYGSLPSYGATFSFGARDLRVASVNVGGLFGSALVTDLPGRARFETAATATDVYGIGAIRIGIAEFRIGNADPARGDVVLNVSSLDTSQLRVHGEYRRTNDSLTVELDTIRFNYKDVRWANTQSVVVHDTRLGQSIERLVLASNEGGVFDIHGELPLDGPVNGSLRLDKFPAGELYAFAMAKKPFSGLISGDAVLSGTRRSPVFDWRLQGDSLGAAGYHLPQITSDGAYRNQVVIARAMMADTVGGSLSLEARIPMDLSLAAVPRRLLSDSVDADLFATQLKLGALGVDFPGIERLQGNMDGHLFLGGTIDRPFAQGSLAIDGFSAWLPELGIEPVEGHVALRASRDSLVLDRLRVRSGGRNDTLSAEGGVRFARGERADMQLRVYANNTLFAHLRDGTRVTGSANIMASGPLRHPTLTGRVVIPEANIIADPLGASTALDLSSPAARELLGSDEVPVAETATESFARLGRFVNVRNAQVEFGDEVWVNTPEATVRLTGGINLVSSGETIAPEGEILAGRGTYRLNLGVVQRSFSIDSGRVRFFGNPAIPATVDMTATNIVRSSESAQIPVRVHIAGTLDNPVLTLSSPDPLYSGAPDSEIISLLIFGAPTFALDGKSQSTVRAVAGVLVPTVGGALEGTLQRLLPFQFNTLQIQTPGGARDDLSAMSLIDNLSIVAGKQLSDRTFLRLNTGVCKGGSASATQGVSLWAGVAIEYLLARQLTLQVGVDPGTSPCSRLSGDVMPRMQFGFDLFRDWVF